MSDEFQRLVGKATMDRKFAETLRQDPEKALKEMGIEPTDELIEALEDAFEAIDRLSKHFGTVPYFG